ncbi:MAG: S-layer homology domain-containing protein [Evtepia sp.]
MEANSSSTQTVTLLKDVVAEDITIPSDKTVTLNLNGKKLTNVSSNTITNNGTLTITGEGTVDNVTHAKAAIYNKSTVTLNGGTYDRSNEDGVDADNAGTNTYYTILNHGKMTVDSSVTVRNKGHHSSLFENGYYSQNSKDGIDNPTLTITSGTYEGGLNTIKNDDDATLTINGGTFTNYTQAAFQNHGTATVTAGSFIANSKYAIDNCGCDATHDPGKLEISGGTFNGTLYIRSAYSNVTISDGYFNGSISKTDGTLTITGGYFTSDPTAYLATGKAAVESDLAGYNYKVDVAKNEKADVAAAKPEVSTPVLTGVDKEAATAVSNALSNSTDTVTGDGLTAAANTIANNNTVNQADATNALKQKEITTEGQTVRIVVQTYMNINIKNVGTTSADKKTLSLDITPMYRTVATTANTDNAIKLTGDSVTGANAVPVGPAGKLIINKPVTIKIPLPTDFVSPATTDTNAYPSIYVQHKGYEYTATVSKESDTLYATFTNPHGFSTFTITTEKTAEATLNGVNYTSFQDAVNAANNGDVITALKDNLSATMSGSPRTITVKSSTGTFNVSVNGETKTADANTGVTFTYTRPSSGGPGSSGGSISAPTTYAVNVNAATNGAVAADKKTASKGTTVTVTASPSKGYVVDAVKVVDKDGKDVAVTEKDGKYVFTMPASAVTVTGSFKAETPAPVALPFTDVKSGNWFYDAVKYAYAQGLMTGTSATTFAPNGTMNRAMIVTVLYRLEKSPAVTGASKFTDVPAGQWYSDAVAWAAANKIVNGYDETTFGPMNAVTREQMAAILFRYEQVKGLENVTLEENLNRFPDQNKISAYAIPALQWAVGQKIINGNADGTLDPTGTATRAQVAQIFTNLLNK